VETVSAESLYMNTPDIDIVISLQRLQVYQSSRRLNDISRNRVSFEMHLRTGADYEYDGKLEPCMYSTGAE
jgi:hypothetical protein